MSLVAAVLAGCLGADDDLGGDGAGYAGADRYEASFADAKPEAATGLEFVSRLMIDNETAWPAGGGNFVLGDYVYGSALSNSFFIADVSDPEDPKLVYHHEEPALSDTPYARKAEVVVHPDGRLTLALATQSDRMHLWNVTDPTNPHWAGDVWTSLPNHYVAQVPGLEVVIINPSGGAGRTNYFVNVSDPYNPQILGTFSEVGCHGTTFLNAYGHDKFRGYCAGIDRTEIWDMTGWDPEADDLGIKILTKVGFEEGNHLVAGNPLLGQYPVRTLHHLATANHDGTILIIGDEHNGGGAPGACYHHDPMTGTSTPLGALWFYDVSDESDPQLLSWISPRVVEPAVPSEPPALPPNNPTNPNSWLNLVLRNVPSCTAHFGEVVDGEEKIVIAWYNAGVLLIDFTDPASPVILDQYQPDPVDTWSARYHNGYVFTGDLARGMEVLRLTG